MDQPPKPYKNMNVVELRNFLIGKDKAYVNEMEQELHKQIRHFFLLCSYKSWQNDTGKNSKKVEVPEQGFIKEMYAKGKRVIFVSLDDATDKIIQIEEYKPESSIFDV